MGYAGRGYGVRLHRAAFGTEKHHRHELRDRHCRRRQGRLMVGSRPLRGVPSESGREQQRAFQARSGEDHAFYGGEHPGGLGRRCMAWFHEVGCIENESGNGGMYPYRGMGKGWGENPQCVCHGGGRGR